MQIPPCPHPRCSNTTEEWLPVIGYERLYEVSNCGRVRSLDRHVRSKHNARMLKHGHILVPEVRSIIDVKNGKIYARDSYVRVLFTVDKKQTHHSVHHLVLEAFCAKRPSPQHQTNHKNGDKTDNHVINLEWCTPSENQIHSRDVLGTPGSRRKHIDTDRVFELLCQGIEQQEVASILGVSRWTINRLQYKKHWTQKI